MAWSYDPALTDRMDEVRFLVGDTVQTDPMMQNEEIERLLVLYPPVLTQPAYLAAAAACDAIASRFGRQTQKSVGALSVSAQQKYEHYKELATVLRTAYQTKGVGEKVNGVITVAAPILGGGGRTVLGDI